MKGPVRIRIERRGERFTVFAGAPGQRVESDGPATVALKDPVYVGLAGVPDDERSGDGSVSNVRVDKPAPRYSRISIYDLKTKRRVLYKADELWEAPNWSMDGKFLLGIRAGGCSGIPVEGGGAPEPLKLDVLSRQQRSRHFAGWKAHRVQRRRQPRGSRRCMWRRQTVRIRS